METEIDALPVEYDEESSGALIRKSSKVLSLIKSFEVVENDEENCSGEVKTGIMKDAESSERTCVEEISSRVNKEPVEGGSNGHFLIMNSSNASAVTTTPTNSTEPHKTQPNAKSEWRVYFVEEEGSEIRDFLDKEGAAIDYENKDAELLKDEKVIQTMAKKTMTQVNENQQSVSETIMLNSLDGFVRAQDEAQLTDHWTRTLENGTSTEKVEERTLENGTSTENVEERTLENGTSTEKVEERTLENGTSTEKVEERTLENGTSTKNVEERTLENGTSTEKVEEIVRVLNEQQSHDLICPACGSCITKRVILRKRKRTSTVSVNRLIQDLDDAEAALLEDIEQITEDQNDQPDISHEDSDENEAYGCLACFSIFLRRDKENESFYCLPFWNAWRESSKKEPNRPVKEFTNSLSHQVKESHGVATQSTSYKTSITATKTLTVLSSMENGASQKTTYTLTEETDTTQYVNESDKSLELKEHFPPAERSEDQPTELHLDYSAKSHAKHEEEQEHAKTEAADGDAFIILPDALPKQTNMQGERIHADSAIHDQESNNLSPAQQGEELQQDTAAQKNGSYMSVFMRSCIPVSNQNAWSVWPFKERINDQLTEPLLPKEKLEENLSEVPDESVSHGILQSGDKESEATLPLISTGVESSSLLEKQDLAPLHSENTEISSDVTVSPIQTVIEVEPRDDSQPSNVATTVSDLARSTTAQLPATKIVTEWDILKSIVYGGLTVSLTSLGVVSSAAGGEAKTLMVIVTGLANLVAGLFVILNNILDLDHYHQDQFIDTVGHSFWFNGSVAIISYLIFGSLAPITYAFSFRRSDDRLYKFIATGAVSLVCIMLLALGKARVSKKSYIRTVILYIVTGFCSAVAGFFAGEYIKKLLEKVGI